MSKEGGEEKYPSQLVHRAGLGTREKSQRAMGRDIEARATCIMEPEKRERREG